MSTKIQSIIFDRSKWTISDAKEWLRDHFKKTPPSDTTDRYYRFRQAPPTSFSSNSFRTIPLGHKGIKAIIGKPKIEPNPKYDICRRCGSETVRLYDQSGKVIDPKKWVSQCILCDGDL